MDFEFSDEQEQLRESVAGFLAARAPLAWVRAQYGSTPSETDEVWRGLCDLGVTGLMVPAACGGAGGGMVDAAVVLEELGRALYPGPYASSAIAAASIVMLAGRPADHAALLPGIAAGTTVGTVALLEGGTRAAWRAPGSRATRADDGWRLDGKKVHVPDLAVADVVLASALEPDGTLAMFAVSTGGPGVRVVPAATVDGTRPEGTLVLEQAPARRLGDGDGTEAVAATVDRVAAAAVVDGVGTAERALEISVEYAKERRQFDALIGSFQAIQHLCADMLRSVELARAAGYYACWAADAAPPAERHRAATMALAFAGGELAQVGGSAVQVHGGIGFTWEHDIHLFYKRLLTLQALGGGSADQLEELAAVVLGPLFGRSVPP
ncbi:MAG TPA: acyl-CoA dehydrogenase family protein [Acidimicrobiia bacterium]